MNKKSNDLITPFKQNEVMNKIFNMHQDFYRSNPQLTPTKIVIMAVGRKSLASYIPEKNIILLREDMLNDFNFAAYVLLHEFRHQIQFHYVKHNRNRFAIALKKSLISGANSIGIGKKSNFDYVRQLHEIDANAFAKAVMLREFGVLVTNYSEDYEKMLDNFELKF